MSAIVDRRADHEFSVAFDGGGLSVLSAAMRGFDAVVIAHR
ncbi:hypothetical protein [Rhodovulum euryhalinum]|nr:hypothetical protein [Rhodovulum euryhalinum]